MAMIDNKVLLTIIIVLSQQL